MNQMSKLFTIKTSPPDDFTEWSPKIAIFGDLGFANGKSINSLINASDSGYYDMYIHVGKILKSIIDLIILNMNIFAGDIAYDLFTVSVNL